MEVSERSEPNFIAFNSFSEFINLADQKIVLSNIYDHLSEKGKFIFTLHNPKIRLKKINNEYKLLGDYTIEKNNGKLLVWSHFSYNNENKIVKGLEFFELYDNVGKLKSKKFLEINYYLHTKKEIEKLINLTKFKILNLYGDCNYTDFEEDESRYMIWILGK